MHTNTCSISEWIFPVIGCRFVLRICVSLLLYLFSPFVFVSLKLLFLCPMFPFGLPLPISSFAALLPLLPHRVQMALTRRDYQPVGWRKLSEITDPKSSHIYAVSRNALLETLLSYLQPESVIYSKVRSFVCVVCISPLCLMNMKEVLHDYPKSVTSLQVLRSFQRAGEGRIEAVFEDGSKEVGDFVGTPGSFFFFRELSLAAFPTLLLRSTENCSRCRWSRIKVPSADHG